MTKTTNRPMDATDPSNRRRCTGHSSRTGEPCKKWAMFGASVCYSHGGSASQVRAAAQLRLAEAEVRRITGAAPMTDPYGALEDLGGRAMALVNRLSHLVDELDDLRYEGGVGGHWEQIRGELPMLLAALRQAESIAGRIVALGLDERRVRVSELQGALILAALEKTLLQLGLDVSQTVRARQYLHEELTRGDSKATVSKSVSTGAQEVPPVGT